MELFDLYDHQRRPLGRTMVRGTKTPDGCYRLVVHISIFNSKGEMLIQQRQSFKDDWQNLWDLSVGGSVTTGETSQVGAERELLEELSITADFQGKAPDLSITSTAVLTTIISCTGIWILPTCGCNTKKFKQQGGQQRKRFLP